MNAGTAAEFVYQSLRVGHVQGIYDNHAVHIGIQTVCSEFVLDTGYTRKVDPLTVASGNAAISGLTGFVPEAGAASAFSPDRVKSIWIDGHVPLKRCSLEELLRLTECGPNSSGRPTHFAFTTATVATVWPTPDAAYTLNMLWSPPFTTWVLPAVQDAPTIEEPDPADDTSKDTIELNLPDDVLKIICTTGVPAHLLEFAPEHAAFAERCAQRYEAFRTRMRGAGNQGSTSGPRSMAFGPSSGSRYYRDRDQL